MKSIIAAAIIACLTLVSSTAFARGSRPHSEAANTILSGALTPSTFRKVESFIKKLYPTAEFEAQSWYANGYGFSKDVKIRHYDKNAFISTKTFSERVRMTWDGKILLDHKHIGNWDELK